MLNLFKKMFSPAPAYATIEIKHMNQEISLFYRGKILTPNQDYSTVDTKGDYSIVKIKGSIDPKFLTVKKCFIPYYDKKLKIQPWGYKKFKAYNS